MGIVAVLPDRYRLPARIRVRNATQGDFSCRLALAERIAALPGVLTEEHAGDALPTRVNVYLQAAQLASRKQHQQQLLCSISRDGVALYGLDAWDKHQVLCAGWGSLDREHVLLFLPRDDQELEVCWEVIQRACQNLSTTLTKPASAAFVSSTARPRFSRTTLQ